MTQLNPVTLSAEDVNNVELSAADVHKITLSVIDWFYVQILNAIIAQAAVKLGATALCSVLSKINAESAVVLGATGSLKAPARIIGSAGMALGATAEAEVSVTARIIALSSVVLGAEAVMSTVSKIIGAAGVGLGGTANVVSPSKVNGAAAVGLGGSGSAAVRSLLVAQTGAQFGAQVAARCPAIIIGTAGMGLGTTAELDGGSVQLLLDAVPNAATAFDFNKKLLAAYDGYIAQIRLSDASNTEYRVKADSNGVFSLNSPCYNLSDVYVNTLNNLIGSYNAYAYRVYDVTGNGRHWQQGTTSQQPQVISSGSVITKDGKAGIYFDGTAQQFMRLVLDIAIMDINYQSNPFSIYVEFFPEDGGGNYPLVCGRRGWNHGIYIIRYYNPHMLDAHIVMGTNDIEIAEEVTYSSSYRLLMTYDGNYNGAFYKQGNTLIGTDSGAGSIRDNPDFTLASGSTLDKLKGLISSVVIWTRELSEAERAVVFG